MGNPFIQENEVLIEYSTFQNYHFISQRRFEELKLYKSARVLLSVYMTTITQS